MIDKMHCARRHSCASMQRASRAFTFHSNLNKFVGTSIYMQTFSVQKIQMHRAHNRPIISANEVIYLCETNATGNHFSSSILSKAFDRCRRCMLICLSVFRMLADDSAASTAAAATFMGNNQLNFDEQKNQAFNRSATAVPTRDQKIDRCFAFKISSACPQNVQQTRYIARQRKLIKI